MNFIYYDTEESTFYDSKANEIFNPITFFISQTVNFSIQFIKGKPFISGNVIKFTPDTFMTNINEISGSVAFDNNYQQFITGTVSEVTSNSITIPYSSYIVVSSTGNIRVNGNLYNYDSVKYSDESYVFTFNNTVPEDIIVGTSVDIFEQLMFKTDIIDFTSKDSGIVTFSATFISERLLYEMNKSNVSSFTGNLQLKINNNGVSVVIISLPLTLNNVVDYQSSYNQISYNPEIIENIDLSYDSTLPEIVIYHDVQTGSNYDKNFNQLSENTLNIFFTQKFNIKTILIDGEPEYNYNTESWKYNQYKKITDSNTFAIISCSDTYGNNIEGVVSEDVISGSSSIKISLENNPILENTGYIYIDNIKIEYTNVSVSDSIYVFTTSNSLDTYVSGTKVRIPTSILFKTAINSSDNTGYSTGEFKTTVFVMSKKLIEKLSFGNQTKIQANIQLSLYTTGNIITNVYNIPVNINNVVDFNNNYNVPVIPDNGSTDYDNVTTVNGIESVYYYDIDSGSWYDSYGNYITPLLENYYGSVSKLTLKYIHGAPVITNGIVSTTPCTDFSGDDITTSFVINNLYSNSFNGSVYEESQSGSSTIKVYSNTVFYIEPTGNIRLYKNNEYTTYTYTTYTVDGNVYQFNLNTPIENNLEVGDLIIIPHALLCKSSGELTDTTQSSNGIFSAKMYFVSNKLISMLDYDNVSYIDAFLQHTIYKSGVAIHTTQVSFRINNKVDNNTTFNVPVFEPSIPESTETPVSSVSKSIFYLDVLSNDVYDSDGALLGNRNIYIYAGSIENFTIQYVVGEVTSINGNIEYEEYTGFNGVSVSSSISVNNTVTQKVNGVLNNISSDRKFVTVSFQGANNLYVGQIGKIVIYDVDSQNSVECQYSSYVIDNNGRYVFNLNNSISELLNINEGSVVTYFEEVMARAVGNSVDDSASSQGLFKFSLKMLSVKLTAMFSSGNVTEVESTLQHAVYSNGVIVKIFNIPVIVRGLIDYGADFSDEIESSTADKTWVLSLFRNSLEFQYSSDGSSWHSEQTSNDVYFRSRISNVDALWSSGVKLPEATNNTGGKIFANDAEGSGYDKAVAYALQSETIGEIISAQNTNGTWTVYQINNNKELSIVSWYIDTITFNSDNLDENGNLYVHNQYYPTAVKGGGHIIGIVPSWEDTENNLYRINLQGALTPGISYKLIMFRE